MGSTRNNAMLTVYVDIRNKDLRLYQDDQLVRLYPILDLKEGLPTGRFAISDKVSNPEIELGSRWLGFNRESLGIHGVSFSDKNQPCLGVRLENDHLDELFSLVPPGTSVEITKIPSVLANLALPNQFGRFPATPSAFPVVAGPHAYIVQKGDTIWKLSKRFKIPMENILAANLLPNPNILEPGQVLFIPCLWPCDQ